MPVRLTDRDLSIFQLIEEHGVLLEKHISYFLCSDQKPSFVRDRLRRLHYFEYLVCGTHDGRLSWWKSPTKPLVYALSPMTRQLIGASDNDLDLRNFELQRHLLEVANIRMIFYKEEQDGKISDLQWSTCRPKPDGEYGLDARVSLVCKGRAHKIGIINQSSRELDPIIYRLHSAIGEEAVEMVCIISPDHERQKALQKGIAECVGDVSVHDCIALAPHKQLYKVGVVKAQWQGIGMRDVSLFIEGTGEVA